MFPLRLILMGLLHGSTHHHMLKGSQTKKAVCNPEASQYLWMLFV